MKKWPLLFVCFLLYCPFSKGQIFDLVLPKGVKQIDVPFEYENDFIRATDVKKVEIKVKELQCIST